MMCASNPLLFDCFRHHICLQFHQWCMTSNGGVVTFYPYTVITKGKNYNLHLLIINTFCYLITFNTIHLSHIQFHLPNDIFVTQFTINQMSAVPNQIFFLSHRFFLLKSIMLINLNRTLKNSLGQDFEIIFFLC